MMSPIPIIPRYKLLLNYDIRNGMQEVYYRYVVGEFVPSLNEMSIYVSAAWHTAYGAYPLRQVEFVCDSLETLHSAFETPRWQELEDRLKTYTSDYHRKIIPYRRGFQF